MRKVTIGLAVDAAGVRTSIPWPVGDAGAKTLRERARPGLRQVEADRRLPVDRGGEPGSLRRAAGAVLETARHVEKLQPALAQAPAAVVGGVGARVAGVQLRQAVTPNVQEAGLEAGRAATCDRSRDS
jgi:hypothetical protein